MTATLIIFAPIIALFGTFFIRTNGEMIVPAWQLPLGIILVSLGVVGAIHYAFYAEWGLAGMLVVAAAVIPAVLAATIGRGK